MSAEPRDVIRADILAMTAYPVQYAGDMVKLDAMENPHRLPQWLREEAAGLIRDAEINRYPDPDALPLKNRLRKVMAVPDCCGLLLGNGSDEIISILISAVAAPETVIMSLAPTFVMFRMSAEIARARYVSVPLDEDFSLNVNRVLAAIKEHRPAIIFIAYPNNPTGNLFDEDDIQQIIEQAPGLVVIDEAYQVFAERSLMPRLPEFPNLVVMRTLSKLGLAGLRLGYAAARPEWIKEFDKVRGPYNVGMLTQLITEKVLQHHDVLEAQAREIIAERTRMSEALGMLGKVRVFPSSANFILLRVPDANQAFSGLKNRGVLVKNLHGGSPLLEECLRFTVGTRAENELLMRTFVEILG